MKVSELTEHMESAYPGMTNLMKMDGIILKMKLLTPGQATFEPNTLYLGDVVLLGTLAAETVRSPMVIVGSPECSDPSCHPNQFNCLYLNDEDSIALVFNRIQDILADHQILYVGSASLLECVIKGKEVRDIVETAYDILDNPVMLMDTSYKVLAYKTDKVIEDEVWGDLVEHGFASFHVVSMFKNERIIEKIISSRDPILLDIGVGEKIQRILGKIMIDGTCVGYLAVLEYNRPFSSEDFHVVSLICDVVSSVMRKGKLPSIRNGQMFDSIIYDLLYGRVSGSEELEGRLNACGWSPTELNIAAIDVSKFNDISFKDYFRDNLIRVFTEMKMVYCEDFILLFLEDLGVMAKSHKKLELLEEFLQKHKFNAGLSNSFTNLLDVRVYYNQAVDALRFVSRSTVSGNLRYFYDCCFESFVHESSRYFQVQSYCHPGVLSLLEYDRNHGTEYFKTLHEFLKCSKNLVDTSLSLCIHRNTVNYRIDRIEELLGIPVRKKDTLNLLLTYKLLEAVE